MGAYITHLRVLLLSSVNLKSINFPLVTIIFVPTNVEGISFPFRWLLLYFSEASSLTSTVWRHSVYVPSAPRVPGSAGGVLSCERKASGWLLAGPCGGSESHYIFLSDQPQPVFGCAAELSDSFAFAARGAGRRSAPGVHCARGRLPLSELGLMEPQSLERR